MDIYKKENILLVGSSGYAKVVIDIIEKEGRYSVIGLLDAFRSVGETTLGYKVLGSETDLVFLITKHKIMGIIIAIGDNSVRKKVAVNIKTICPDVTFISTVHPSASIAKETSIGRGSVIMAGAVVGPCCNIGEFCIVNTNSSLDHDSLMGNFSSLAPRVSTGGNCKINDYSAIGIGATLRHGISVGQDVVVGAGALVMGDLEKFGVYYGVPAIKIRSRQHGDRYF